MFVDTVSAEGPLYGGGVYSWNKDQGILTITGHADKEISSYVDVIAKKGDRQAKYTIHFKCRPLVDKFNRLVLEIQEVSDTQNAESGCLVVVQC
ncbi:MAG: hypothetical protein OXL96_08070 [Candidatus Poribacteria bacterium]|nr:hypothetical protein [Candidatus Poribacteria bacterium]